jgi:VWFA-related protein
LRKAFNHITRFGRDYARRTAFPGCLFFAITLTAASTTFAQEVEPGDVIKVNTNLVVFDVQVFDKKTNSIIGGLTKADFEIADRGIKQKVTYFSHDELPLSIMILLDVSDSVRPFIHRIRDGAVEALRHLKAEDQVAVMAFATSSEMIQDFTADRNLVASQIELATGSDQLGRQTGFAAAMDNAAVRMLNSPQGNRSVIIVITDNFFFTSAFQEKLILSDLFRGGSVVYGLLVNTSNPSAGLNGGFSPGVDHYVARTGGEILSAGNHDVAAKLALLIDHLRFRYAVGFRPSDTKQDDKLRLVEIKITSDQRKDKDTMVLTRRGYYFRRRSGQ